LRLVASRRNQSREVFWDPRLATHESRPLHHLRERSFMPDGLNLTRMREVRLAAFRRPRNAAACSGYDPAPAESARTRQSRPLVHRRLPALRCRSWRFSRSATASTTKCHRAVAPALQAAPSVLASVDSQIVRRQRVSPATMAWDILPPDFAAINMEEVDDRRTISTEHAPATNQ
jgi:hypothetical protein